MTTYRTDDLTRWGAGIGRNLTPTEVDVNFWGIDERIEELEAAPPPPPAIESFEVSGTTFYVNFVGGSQMGPYELPVAVYNPRGEWAAGVDYTPMDLVTINGSLYLVRVAHTSAPTFDPGLAIGGQDVYFEMMSSPESSMPAGGATNQVLAKSSGTDYAVTWAWKTPTAGMAAGKYLRASSSTPDNTAWTTIDAGEVDFVAATDSILAATNVADALEELASGVADAPNSAEGITFTPVTGSDLTADDVQNAIEELEELIPSNVGSGSYEPNPVGNISTSARAMGLGGGSSAFLFTPEKTGIALVWIGGMATNTTAIGSGVTITGRHGTGTAPINGASSGLGTAFGTPQRFVASTTAGQQGFIVMGKVTGLTIGEPHWFDLSIVAVTSGGATVKDVQFIAIEAS